MKCFFYILILLLLTALLGRYLYTRFIEKAKINAVVDFSKIFTDKKIPYKVDYSGVQFSGVYDLKDGTVKTEGSGKIKIQTFRKDAIFGINILDKGKLIKSFVFDLYSMKLIINA